MKAVFEQHKDLDGGGLSKVALTSALNAVEAAVLSHSLSDGIS
jgi:hypothetical protein